MLVFSVILTTYNSGSGLPRVIRAIEQQQGAGQLFELELIVVDDCSTDDTHALLRDNGVAFLTTEKNSGGPNRGRNIGLTVATGDYLCFADHDDVWHPNRLLALLPHLGKAPILTSGYTVEDQQYGKTMHRVQIAPGEAEIIFYPENTTFLHKLRKDNSGQTTYLGSIVYSNSLRHIRFEEHFGMVDFDWVLRLFHQQASLEVCLPLYTRHVFGANLSLNDGYRRKDFYYSLMSIEPYAAEFPRDMRRGYLRIHGSRARYYYLMGDMARARFFFRRSGLTLVNVLYYLTTYLGHNWVKKRFNVFG